MDANCRELGYTSMTDNADTNPGTTRPKSSNPSGSASPLVNEVNVSSDTSMMDVPTAGTVESGGING